MRRFYALLSALWVTLAGTVASFGGVGTGPGQFDREHALAVDAKGRVFVADRTNRVQWFDPSGGFQGSLLAETQNQPRGPMSDDIRYILGLAVDRAGLVYVALGYDIHVFSLTPEAKRLRTIRGVVGQTCYRELAFDQTETLYARSHCSDEHKNAIVKLSRSGTVLKRFEEAATFERAATAQIAVDGSGNLYVPHGYEHEIQVLTPKGDIKTRIGRKGSGPGEFADTYLGPVAFDPDGALHIRYNGSLERFDQTGRHLGRIPLARGCRPGDFAFAPDGDVWVFCNASQRAEKLSLAGAPVPSR